jgi:DNA-binding response OmpR family regulator
MRVLIAEDNAAFASLVAARLDQSGIDSDVAGCVAAARRAISAVEYAAIILDLGLRGRDGLELLRQLRSHGDSTRVLIATARHSLEHRVRALRDGADDYLVKPFSLSELVARLQAVMRRPGLSLKVHTLRAGNVLLDVKNRQVNIGEHVQVVRRRETFILELLMRNLSSVVRRKHFEDRLFGVDEEQESNTVDVYVHRLRRQLADGGATVSIHTVRGVGYMMTEENRRSRDVPP